MPADSLVNSDSELRNQTCHCSAAPSDNMNNCAGDGGSGGGGGRLTEGPPPM